MDDKRRHHKRCEPQALAHRCCHWLLVDCLPVIAFLLLMAWAMALVPAHGKTVRQQIHLPVAEQIHYP